ncbi:Uncharacterised protein [uncultured archaeon]|nr:Uncharacterised protein [uncultured archaeon]
MNITLEEIPELREFFLDQIADENQCPNCGSYDNLGFESFRRCYGCNTNYEVLRIQRSCE